jgi:hypothetical protein
MASLADPIAPMTSKADTPHPPNRTRDQRWLMAAAGRLGPALEFAGPDAGRSSTHTGLSDDHEVLSSLVLSFNLPQPSIIAVTGNTT